jgi:uncharacterized protein YbaR (Trm112 family)/ubiquinone/menaquinone biosynthesis C-methylase UbiE
VRLYVLDKLICPRCEHFPLVLKIIEEHEAVAPTASKKPCALFCAHEADWLRNIHYQPPCSYCLKRNVTTGELVCATCLSHFPINDGIPNLLVDELVNDWVIAEQSWWDERYTQVRKNVDTIKLSQGLAGPRNYERAKYLFVPLKQRGVLPTALLEVGAGTAQYVARLFPPSAEQYFYIATDIAREALLVGTQIIPEGDFVQSEAGRLPFRKESFDTLLCFGVLHHLPRWQRSLERMIELLKPGGWILFNEAIAKPRMLRGFLKRSLGTTIDSPHGGELEFEALIIILQRNGVLIVSSKKTTTLRVLLIWLLGWFLERSVLLTELVLWLDDIFLRSIGQAVQRLGPAEVLGIFEKTRRCP